MPTRTAPPHPRTKPVFWVLYQGIEGKAYAEQLRPEAAKLNCELRLTGDHEPSSRWNVLARVRQDCVSCDAAIALVTPDPRPSSQTGNLWLETGLWLGSRDWNLLRILQHRKTKLPSDFAGVTVDKFGSEDQLKKVFNRQVALLNKIVRPGPTSDTGRTKVQAVFDTARDKTWLRPESYCCHRYPKVVKPCDFRETTLEFAAELLRMGRVNHERHTIEDALSRFAYKANQLYVQPTPPKPAAVDTRRRVFLELLGERDVLRDSIKMLFDTFGRRTYAKRLTQEDRFICFLDQKLELAARLAKDLPLPDGFNATLIQNRQKDVTRTWKWLKEFDDPQFLSTLETGNWDVAFQARFKQSTDFCLDVGLILQSLSAAYFQACRRVLGKHTRGVKDPKTVHENLRKAIRQLPHNSADPHVPIWRA